MPHAEPMSSPVVNGETPSSQFLSHLTSYPVVSDSIHVYKSNPYGAKSLSYADSGYNSFVKPVLPYASKPYAYVSPYVERADHLASSGLDKVDHTFPIVTKDIETIKQTAMSFATLPVRMAGETKNYVFGTWANEYKKCGGDGVVAGGKAMITTGLLVTSDTLSWISKVLSKKKAEAEVAVKEKMNN